MDDSEGWGSVRFSGGGRDKTMINTLMLRFRPIAPKPAAGAPQLGRSQKFKDNAVVPPRRTKRKYVRVRRSCKESKERGSATTLQLLDEKKVSSNGGGATWCSDIISPGVYSSSHTVTVTDKEEDLDEASNPFIRRNLNLNLTDNDREEALGEMRGRPETLVTVDNVSVRCMDGLGLGCTDAEKLTNLDVDTCPGFVSDGLNRVVWVNRAFRKMVMCDRGEWPEMEVRLVMREEAMVYMYSAFTCQVKVKYTWRKEKFSNMVPCDAWRMDGGGLAWRLDVKAALCLGR